jgi:hypothetical protein
MALIIYIFIDIILELLISFLPETLLFPIIPRLYVLTRESERKDHQSRIECDEKIERSMTVW